MKQQSLCVKIDLPYLVSSMSQLLGTYHASTKYNGNRGDGHQVIDNGGRNDGHQVMGNGNRNDGHVYM